MKTGFDHMLIYNLITNRFIKRFTSFESPVMVMAFLSSSNLLTEEGGSRMKEFYKEILSDTLDIM